ncbi:MAG: nucleotidyltransferase domain-containing protein [bacterium]|nr:nucleotidyltransferase domain-containing protein [bacterium]
MASQERLPQICRRYGLQSIYLFGSRADEGLRLLAGEAVARDGSDLDVGVVFCDPEFDLSALWGLQVELEELFAPLRVDLVPIQKLDAIFQFRAIDGHRLIETDPTRNAYYELAVMRRAAELLPIERRLERDFFGLSTT